MHLLSTFEVGGAECVAHSLARQMLGSRFEPMACALFAGGGLRERFRRDGIRTRLIAAVPQEAGFKAGLVPRLARVLRREQTDVLHCHNRRAHVYGVLAGKAAGVPAVLCTHHGMRNGGVSAMERVTGMLAGHEVAVCRQVLRREQQLGTRGRRLSVIYNGIDTARFRLATPYEECGEGLTLGCVGRLSPEKGHRFLLRALAQVLGDGLDVRLRMAGDGPSRGDLAELAESLGISGRVEFLGERGDIPAVLKTFDIFVLPSLTEGLPLTVLEAMASGLPVIAARVGGVAELVQEGRTGLLVPPGRPEELARAVRTLRDDEALRRRVASCAEQVARDFDSSVMARSYAELYTRLLGS